MIKVLVFIGSILILGTLGTPHAFAQLCPIIPGCLTDNLYVLDSEVFKVKQYDSAGSLLNANFAPGLSSPTSIAFDSTGKFYVVDTGFDTVRQYNSAGSLLNANFITGLNLPTTIAFDSTGNLYVLDAAFNTVRQYNSAGSLLNANFAPGLNDPTTMAFDSTGNLYVADAAIFELTVKQYDSAGSLLNANFVTGLSIPVSIAFDSTGKFYVVDLTFDTVRQYNSAGALLDADFAPGLSRPFTIAFDSTGKFYVVDSAFDTVRQYNSAGSLLNANFAPGLIGPRTIAFDSSGSTLSVETDRASYIYGDTIRISGNVGTLNDSPLVSVTMLMIDPIGETMRVGQVVPSKDGSFHFTLTAGRIMQISGDYTITAQYDLQKATTTFYFGTKTVSCVLNQVLVDGKCVYAFDIKGDVETDPDDTIKVTICHTTRAPYNYQTIDVSESALQAHLDHGDTLGECSDISGQDSKETKVPGWIKNNAKWWAKGQINDDSFVQGLEWMIQEDVMRIPPTAQGHNAEDVKIPGWIKNNAKWWAGGQINDDSFVNGIQWLIENGIMRIR